MNVVVRKRTPVFAARCAVMALGLSAGFASCAIEPPKGAYEPANYDQDFRSTGSDAPDGGGGLEMEASVPTFLGGASGGGGTPGGTGMAGGQGGTTGGGQVGGTQGGGTTGGGTQGGAGGTSAGGTAGGSVSPEVARLQKLAGYYYMRMDMRSTISARSILGNVRTRNRVSHLLVTQLGVNESGQLVGLEQMCHQTFAIECAEGCSMPSSIMRPEVRNELVKVRPTRNYQASVSGSSLHITGAMQTLYLGFDATSNPSLPTSTSDARVWLNGSGNSAREGMWLYVDTRSSSGLLRVQCDVYTVQSFVSKFDGTLGGTLDEPTFMGMSATLDSTGTTGATIGSSDPNNCADDPANPATTTSVEQTVRFARANVATGQEAAFWGCPETSAWDGPLPPPAP